MGLRITISAGNPLQLSTDLVAIGVPQGPRRTALLKELTEAVGPTVTKTIKRNEFTGKAGQLCEIATGGKLKAASVLLVGLGEPSELDAAGVRRLAAKTARHAAGSRCTSLGFLLPDDVEGGERAAAEGIVLGAYRFERFKTGDRLAKFPLERASLFTSGKVTAARKDAVDVGQRVGEAICIARDLINMPPNELYPETLADYAANVAKDNKDHGLSATVLGHKQLKDKGMHLLDAVGRGSARGPRFVHMKYRPPGNKKKLQRLVFVGKGLTFDTGGICIKPAPGMEEMKGDMGGAANVVALMAAIAATKPEAEIHGLIACAENMPDGNAYRPGDIFSAYDGKTVEIINTDAEGRLALADALGYGVQLEPDFMLDNATLTGACVVALGPTVSGFYSNRDDLAELVNQSAKTAGEAMWRMPLVEDLREKLKSDWADLKHMGDRWGGSITAALFLREFVSEVPWVHVDIAGPSMADKPYGIYAKGGTGHGVLTYLSLIDALIARAGAPAEAAEEAAAEEAAE
jgi:leucyl aminopeptidase